MGDPVADSTRADVGDRLDDAFADTTAGADVRDSSMIERVQAEDVGHEPVTGAIGVEPGRRFVSIGV
jgi:hypothetical protein